MKIGLIADSHDHLEHLELAVQLFKARGVTTIWHAGDMTTPRMILAMRGFALAAVFGNNDHDRADLLRACNQIGGIMDGEMLELDAPDGPGQVALYHGTDPAFLTSLIQGGSYRVVVSGHTHRPKNQMVGKTLVLNPGTAHGFRQHATVMIYDTVLHAAELIDLSQNLTI
ncbi:MAG: YfcE family phosphodiesterase [Magnetococcus sp. YQC-5]